MSADIENNKEDGKPQENEVEKDLKSRILNKWSMGLKLLELTFAAVCLGLIYEPVQTVGMANTQLHHIGIMYTAYTGSMVVILGLIVARCLRENLGYKITFVFSCIHAVLFLTTAILLTADRSELTKDNLFHPRRYLLNMMTACIVLTFVNAAVFTIDAVLTFVKKQAF